MAKRVKLKLNNKEVEANEGQLVIDVAKEQGVEIPHYCYHPALGNPGNCRMCIVEVAGAPKPMVSCRLGAREGMDVKSDSEAAKRAQQSALELHLVNHPLDCPVCDQSGECGLQDYYMKVGQYQSQVREDKQHKNKRLPVGPHVMLDQERCILCTRCTRFVDEVTKTHELGIFRRGHSEVVDLAPGKTLDNPYSGNVADICPVGALTDRDFRFKVRVWYLDRTASICSGCSRGCNIEVHTNTKRPWHNEGKRIGRYKPRYNADVNGYWLCDEGRYSYKRFDQDRLGRVLRLRPEKKDVSWETAAAELGPLLASAHVVASGMLSNEDWLALRAVKTDNLFFGPEPEQVGVEDELLRKRDKVPNLKGAGDLKSGSFDELAREIEAGRVKTLWVIERELDRVWGLEKAKALLAKCGTTVLQSPFKGALGEPYHWRLPSTAHVEEEGHFTNFEGRVQKYERALEPIGSAKPDWEILKLLAGVPA